MISTCDFPYYNYLSNWISIFIFIIIIKYVLINTFDIVILPFSIPKYRECNKIFKYERCFIYLLCPTLHISSFTLCISRTEMQMSFNTERGVRLLVQCRS